MTTAVVEVLTQKEVGGSGRVRWWVGVMWVGLVVVMIVAGVEGMKLRRWAWEQTVRVRFVGDVANGYNWGMVAADRGVEGAYRVVVKQHRGEGRPDYGLDYPPLRLTVMKEWVEWTRGRWPGVGGWRGDYEFNRPMLWGNAMCEGVAGVLAFVLIWVWCGRQGDGVEWRMLKGMVGGLLVWFNPALVWDGHCWPQWDVWILPVYMGAVLAASWGGWFWAGVLIGVGGMLKGQIFLAGPVLLLWGALGGWRNVLGMVSGLVLGVAAVVGRWEVRTVGAGVWVGVVAVVVIVGVWWGWKRGRRRAVLQAGGLVLGVAVLLGGVWFGGNWDWLRVGFGYGATKFMTLGSPGTSNLCWILHERYGWRKIVGEEGSIHLWGRAVALKWVLWIVYAGCVGVCGWGAARQAKVGSARVLAAVGGIWVALFAVLPQMNARYLVWGAGMMALMPALGVGMTLLGVFVMVVTWGMMADIMCRLDPGALPGVWEVVGGLNPDVGWGVMLAAGVLMYVGWTRVRVRGQ